MEKAYDLKDLKERLAKAGLVTTELGAKKLIEELFEWLTLSAQISDNVFDDMFSTVYPKIKDLVLEQADKISDDV